MAEVSESLFAYLRYMPITVADSARHKQDHEGIYEAHARHRDERRELQAEGHCGSPYCPCQIKCVEYPRSRCG